GDLDSAARANETELNPSGRFGAGLFVDVEIRVGVNETLARGVNGERSGVAEQPAAAEAPGDDAGRARDEEKIGDEAPFLGRRANDPLKQRLRFLRRVPRALRRRRRDAEAGNVGED